MSTASLKTPNAGDEWPALDPPSDGSEKWLRFGIRSRKDDNAKIKTIVPDTTAVAEPEDV